MFKITDHIEFNTSGRAVCPSCEQDGKGKKQNLALVPGTDGAYKCHRGCSAEDIRAALGVEKSKPIPTALQPKVAPKKVLVSPQKVKAAHEKLMESDGPAKKWLCDRGIDADLMRQHQLGIARVRVGQRRAWAIAIPLLDDGGTSYQLKKRVAPWDDEITALDEYQGWKQYGVPKRVWFTHQPEDAKATWLCEGEWDAMMLGRLARDTHISIAVACFTTGCGSVPPAAELDKLLGKVFVFYDRNDEPLKNGQIPGDVGARKAAIALGDRGRIAKVPMPDDCTVKGWDVSDAINNGSTMDDFMAAANVAVKPSPKGSSSNSLRNALVWNDDLVNNAPDYTEFLVPELLTEDELFLLAAGPRTGKSLLAMTLAKAVATGGQFMGRPCTQGTVIYAKCEDSDTKIKERQQAQEWGEGLPVAWLNDFKLSNMAELEALVAELDPRLLVLDTLSRVKDSAISESSAEMSQLLEPLQSIANKYGCCVLLVHHTGKVSVDNANKVDIFDTIRGSSAIRAVCRGSMILAAGERSYRLVVENGWGKHDLKVVLDAATLTWKQLGEWRPPVNMTQQDQIIEALKKWDKASVERLHDETGIAKKSLYEQLSRLVNSDVAGEKVIKEGKRRNYTYRLALFNTSQQLNSVLNRPNPVVESDKGSSQQNNSFPRNISTTQISTTQDVPADMVEMAGRNFPLNTGGIVDYNPQTQSQQESYSQHAIQLYSTNGEDASTGGQANLSSDVPVEKNEGGRNLDPDWDGEKISTTDRLGTPIEEGGKVRYTGGNMARSRVCGRKKLAVVSINDAGYVVVNHKTWQVTQTIDPGELEVVS